MRKYYSEEYERGFEDGRLAGLRMPDKFYFNEQEEVKLPDKFLIVREGRNYYGFVTGSGTYYNRLTKEQMKKIFGERGTWNNNDFCIRLQIPEGFAEMMRKNGFSDNQYSYVEL